MSRTDGLLDFLLARITEDEAQANEALSPPHMYPYGDRTLPQMTAEDWPDAMRGYLGGPWGEHGARWNPTRVLRDCAARRQIVDACTITRQFPPPRQPWYAPLAEWVTVREVNSNPQAEVTLLALAAAYADHPDFRQHWLRDDARLP